MEFTDYTTEDFLTDVSFVNYCLRSDEHDVAFWEAWTIANPNKRKDLDEAVSLFSTLNGGWRADQLDENFKTFQSKLQKHIGTDTEYINKKKKSAPLNKLMYRLVAAAVVLVVLSIGLFYSLNNSGLKEATVNRPKSDVAPGGNKAFLILANGKKISLTDAAKGGIVKQAGISISKTAEGELVYTVSETGKTTDFIQLNTITTPKGGQWQVRLPDGTRVWLNAASALKYPVSFRGAGQRKVELIGEAYFEVAKDKEHPFWVHTIQQNIEVTGTHFNVNSYADEMVTKTTLLEGEVRVSASENSIEDQNIENVKILKPGEQAVLRGKEIQIRPVNASDVIAWKNGFFQFDDAGVKTVIRQLSRWYDVDATYEGTIPERRFSGKIYRNLNLSEALKVLEFTGLKFSIEGRHITIKN